MHTHHVTPHLSSLQKRLTAHTTEQAAHTGEPQTLTRQNIASIEKIVNHAICWRVTH